MTRLHVDDKEISFRLLAEESVFSSPKRRTTTGPHPAYYPVGTENPSSSSLARQPLVGPGLLKNLCPFISLEGDFLYDVVPGRSVRF
jgi:hypothetical protein